MARPDDLLPWEGHLIEPNESSAATTLRLVRDGTIFTADRTEIDFRTPDYRVWLTIEADSDADAEAVAAALEATFGGNDA